VDRAIAVSLNLVSTSLLLSDLAWIALALLAATRLGIPRR